MAKTAYQLHLDTLEVQVHLGVPPAEMAILQTISIELKITFTKPPAACISDNIQDTVCYDDLCQKIIQFCQSRSFHLLEHLGHNLYHHLLADIKKYGNLWLKISKTSPCPGLSNSRFSIGK